MSLRAVIVDDEQHARENLRLLLDEFCPEIELLGLAASAEEAREMIIEKDPQLIFLDIRMPAGTEGFELLASLPEKSFQVIFVTAFKDYAVQGFKANGILFLLKPLHIGDLREVIEVVVQREKILSENSTSREVYFRSLQNLTDHYLKNLPSKSLTLVSSEEFQLLSVTNICFFETRGSGTKIYCQSGHEYNNQLNLREYEEMLDPRLFFRISRKHLVHLSFVKQLNDRNQEVSVKMDGGKILEVLSTRLPELRQALKKFNS